MSEFSKKLADTIEEAVRRHNDDPWKAMLYILDQSDLSRARAFYLQEWFMKRMKR